MGAAEGSQVLSTTASANNDVLTGTSGGNLITGLAGNDLLRGLGGNDTLNGGNGSDFLDGGAGNDRLNGGTGIDLVSYAGAAKVVVDLSGATDTAKRGSETDTLTGVEGAIGSSADDIFKGDNLNNYFQGGAGRDIYTGGGGRDLFDIDAAAHSPFGSQRDVVTDFVHMSDHLDVSGIDADATLAGNQAFRFVGTAALGTTPGAIGYHFSGANTIVSGNTDTDVAIEFQIQLNGHVTLSADDLYL